MKKTLILSLVGFVFLLFVISCDDSDDKETASVSVCNKSSSTLYSLSTEDVDFGTIKVNACETKDIEIGNTSIKWTWNETSYEDVAEIKEGSWKLNYYGDYNWEITEMSK